MALFLVQHGICLSKDKDPEKGLSEKGIEQTKLIATVAKNYQIPVKKIVHSGKKRAEQTAIIFKDTFELDGPVERVDGINPMDDVILFANTIDSKENAMIIGHLPFMERLVSYLTCNNKDILIYRFQNSGIVCLDAQKDGWFIKWTLNPDIS
ncbi:MAG: phosphohistidine phosphatase SixA [Pseudomonadota bacterium]